MQEIKEYLQRKSGGLLQGEDLEQAALTLCQYFELMYQTYSEVKNNAKQRNTGNIEKKVA